MGSRVRVKVYRHVIFDLDGTLVDSLEDLAGAVNHVRRELGMTPLAPATVRTHVGQGARYLIDRAVCAEAPERTTDALEQFLEYYGRHLLDHSRLYPGVEAMLGALATAGVKLSVLSNKPEELSRRILEGLGVHSYFTEIVGGDSLSARKPDPAGVVFLMRATATTAAETLMVGDSGIDARTAAAAGVAFCGVAWGFKPDGLRADGVTPIIAAPSELLGVVCGLRE